MRESGLTELAGHTTGGKVTGSQRGARRSRFVQSLRSEPVPAPPAVWLIDQPTCAEHEHFVARHPAGLLYHTLAWMRACEQVGLGRATPLAAVRDERFVAVLPLVETISSSGERALVSVSAAPAAGVLNADDELVEHLLRGRVRRLAESRGVAHVTWHAFAPPQSLHDTGSSPGWIIAPLRGLLGVALGSGASDPNRAAAVCLDAPLPDARSVGGWCQTPLLVASALADSRLMPRCTRVTLPDGTSASAWWTLFGLHAHVLAYSPAAIGIGACLHLAQAVARQAESGGAEWLDTPLPPTKNGWLGRLLSIDRLRISAEIREIVTPTASNPVHS
ncbi:MAG: hypothetical protein U1D55_05675 [Phycisphaerae bacterium]